jgi:hypothetical protein
MTYTVTLCDNNFHNVADNRILLQAVTPKGGVVLDSQQNGTIGGTNGAILSFMPAQQRFNLEIDTRGTTYAPLVLPDLNGDRRPQAINVILLPKPTRHTGPKPTTAAAVRTFIQRQNWTAEEVAAVYTTINTLSILKGVPRSEFRPIRRATEDTLSVLGIDPELIT